MCIQILYECLVQNPVLFALRHFPQHVLHTFQEICAIKTDVQPFPFTLVTVLPIVWKLHHVDIHIYLLSEVRITSPPTGALGLSPTSHEANCYIIKCKKWVLILFVLTSCTNPRVSKGGSTQPPLSTTVSREQTGPEKEWYDGSRWSGDTPWQDYCCNTIFMP